MGRVVAPHRLVDPKAGPLIAVPGAQCLREMAFDFALLVHAGDWQSGQVVRQADRFNSRLLVVAADSHPGQLAPPWGSFLRLDDPSGQLKVTAIKRSEDGRALLVRLHNPTLLQLSARIWPAFGIKQAFRANLAEEPEDSISIEDHHLLPVTAGPKKIVTLLLEIEPASAAMAPAARSSLILASSWVHCSSVKFAPRPSPPAPHGPTYPNGSP